MRGDTLTVTTTMHIEECCNCGIQFAFPEALHQELLKKRGPQGRRFSCPNGHDQWYTGESDADKFRRERDLLKQQNAQLEDAAAEAYRQATAAQKETRRLKKRVGNGVCPCCTRSFINLKRHISVKHPDYNVVPLKTEVA